MRNTRSRSLVPFLAVLVWSGGKDAKKPVWTIILCFAFFEIQKGDFWKRIMFGKNLSTNGEEKNYSVEYKHHTKPEQVTHVIWTPGTSCSKVGWLYLQFRLLWFPNSPRCLISTQYKSLEWSYLTNDKREQIQLTTEKMGLPVGKYHRRLINLHFWPEIYR